MSLDSAGIATTAIDDLSIGLRSPCSLDELAEVVADVEPEHADARVDPRRLDAVKFASCLPDAEVERMLQARDRDPAGVAAVITEPIVVASG